MNKLKSKAGRKELPAIFITDTLAQQTAALLDSFAERAPAEGVVYWFGLELGKRAVVTTLIVPDAETGKGGVYTTVEANAQALSAIVGTPLALLGQAHSHPTSSIQHSLCDDRCTYGRFDGALSVVVPYFGRYGLYLDQCGVYRHIDGGYRFVEMADRHRHLIVLPGLADFRTGGSS